MVLRARNDPLSLQVCTSSESPYTGYDRLLGLCLCAMDDLEEICDEECRIGQYDRILFVCSETVDPYVRVTYPNGSVAVSTKKNTEIVFDCICFQIGFFQTDNVACGCSLNDCFLSSANVSCFIS